jgi:hypothetical protein
MNVNDVDLNEFAVRLKEQAAELAKESEAAKREAKAVEDQPEPEVALASDFGEKLDQSLEEPRQRLRELARSARG